MDILLLFKVDLIFNADDDRIKIVIFYEQNCGFAISPSSFSSIHFADTINNYNNFLQISNYAINLF